jgi:hypothetical protein
VAKKSDTHARPLALNTVQLLKSGSAAFGMSPQQTVELGAGVLPTSGPLIQTLCCLFGVKTAAAWRIFFFWGGGGG